MQPNPSTRRAVPYGLIGFLMETVSIFEYPRALIIIFFGWLKKNALAGLARVRSTFSTHAESDERRYSLSGSLYKRLPDSSTVIQTVIGVFMSIYFFCAFVDTLFKAAYFLSIFSLVASYAVSTLPRNCHASTTQENTADWYGSLKYAAAVCSVAVLSDTHYVSGFIDTLADLSPALGSIAFGIQGLLLLPLIMLSLETGLRYLGAYENPFFRKATEKCNRFFGFKPQPLPEVVKKDNMAAGGVLLAATPWLYRFIAIFYRLLNPSRYLPYRRFIHLIASSLGTFGSLCSLKVSYNIVCEPNSGRIKHLTSRLVRAVNPQRAPILGNNSQKTQNPVQTAPSA